MKRISAHKRASHRKRSTQAYYLNIRFIGVIFVALLLILIKSDTLQLKNGSVLGLRFLAQDMTAQQPMMQQPPPPSQNNSQPQQSQPAQQVPPNSNQPPPPQGQKPMSQEQMQNMTPEQQRQYGIQHMTAEQQVQNRQYEKMTPQQQQEYNKQINEQIKQKYGDQAAPQGQTQNGSVPTQQSEQLQGNQTESSKYQTTQQELQQMNVDQKQQYQKYLQSTPQQQEEMRKQYEKQAQQQWQQEAAKNGFRIAVPTGGAIYPAFPNSQAIGKETGSQTQTNGALPPLSSFPTVQGQFFVGSTNGGTTVNLNDKNTNVILGSNNSIKAKRADGTEIIISKDALEKITTAIKLETGSEISQIGNVFVMKRGQIEANTNFPISFNIATKTFSIETPTGTKEVTVLPDQAVEKAIQSGIINTTNNPQGTPKSKVSLTEFNNQPVYQVDGQSQQKMFGFLPVSIVKTTYVSAENGSVVTTNQSILSRFLDTISF